MSFAIRREQSARIAQGGLLQAACEDAGGNLAVLNGEIASAADGAGAIFRRERGGIFPEAIHLAIALFAGQRKKMRILWLAVREGKRRFNRAQPAKGSASSFVARQTALSQ